MHGKRTSSGSNRRPAMALAAALVLAGTWLGTGGEPVGAAVPGKNGPIVFASNRTTGPGVDHPTGDSEIFTMNPNGSDVRQLTFNTGTETDPAWSPDGTRIAFTSSRNNDREVFTMKADGSDQTNRTPQRGEDGQPDWQPKPR